MIKRRKAFRVEKTRLGPGWFAWHVYRLQGRRKVITRHYYKISERRSVAVDAFLTLSSSWRKELSPNTSGSVVYQRIAE